MGNEPRPDRFKHAVLRFYGWLGALALAIVLPFFAQNLADSRNTIARALAVVLGTLAWIPMLAVVVVIIRQGDEYHRRLHLTAGAIAFVATLLLLLPTSWLVEAGFVDPPSLQLLFVASMLLWGAILLIVKRRFERTS
jgi:uncharacterized membrane protein YozB (DUF420 family)